MRGRIRPGAMVALTLAVVAAAIPCTAGEVDVDVEADLASSYIWRGIEFDDEASLQPSLTLGWNVSDATTLALNGWWNIALDDHGSDDWKDLLFEEDLTVSVDHLVSDAVTLSAGYVYYSNPRSDVEAESESWQTDELYAGLGWSVGAVSLSATAYRDVDRVDGWYGDLSVGWSVSLGGEVSLEGGLHAGLASDMDPDPEDPAAAWWYLDDGLVDGSAAVGVTWSRGVLTVGLSGTHSRRFDDADREGLEESSTWGALHLGLSF